jgi:peptidoglycan hydrolase-like protein with peptidoglycan-binding domain
MLDRMADLVIDFAATDSVKVPDLATAYKSGMRIGVPRAIYGSYNGKPIRDPNWANTKDLFAKAGMLCTAYLFLVYPTKASPNVASPEDQAQALYDYAPLDPHVNYPPVIDVEQASDLLSHSEMIAWTNRAVKKLLELYKVLPIDYTSDRCWIENLGNPTMQQAGLLGQCIPWIAKPWPWNVRTPIHLDGAPQYQPKTISQLGDQTFWLWYQYQGDATGMPGFPSLVDASRPNIVREGAKGTIVMYIQKRVGATPDGVWGPLTTQRVKTFQIDHGLEPDAVIGPRTWQPLLWAPPTGAGNPYRDSSVLV